MAAEQATDDGDLVVPAAASGHPTEARMYIPTLQQRGLVCRTWVGRRRRPPLLTWLLGLARFAFAELGLLRCSKRAGSITPPWFAPLCTSLT